MILRSCTIEDLGLLNAWDSEEDNMWPGDKRKYLEERLNNPQYYMYIGETGIFAMCWGQIKVESDCCILSWFVAPGFRGTGEGTKLASILADMCDLPIKAKINTNRPYSERIAIYLGLKPETVQFTGEKWWVCQ